MFPGAPWTATVTPGPRRTTRRKASRRPLGGSAITQPGLAATMRSSTMAQSSKVANWLRDRGVGRGDRIAVILGNQVELWESMLVAIKLARS